MKDKDKVSKELKDKLFLNRKGQIYLQAIIVRVYDVYVLFKEHIIRIFIPVNLLPDLFKNLKSPKLLRQELDEKTWNLAEAFTYFPKPLFLELHPFAEVPFHCFLRINMFDYYRVYIVSIEIQACKVALSLVYDYLFGCGNYTQAHDIPVKKKLL